MCHELRSNENLRSKFITTVRIVSALLLYRMLPYSSGIILDNTNNYSIVKTETLYGFAPSNGASYGSNQYNTTEPIEWIITQRNFERRSLQDEKEPRKASTKKVSTEPMQRSKKKIKKRLRKKLKRKGKGKKCIFKILKKGSRKKNRGGKFKMHKKYMLPVIIGLFAAKSLLIHVALKALAFISAKGLMMGFFSTVMASVLSLKGMFDHSHAYAHRKDDTKTQVEIIQIPTKNEHDHDHVYYDEHYRRGDYIPVHYISD